MAGDGARAAVGLVALVSAQTATGTRHSISWLLVHPAARRQGVGRGLVELACHHAWDQAAAEVWVECHRNWEPAIAFWTAMGFREQSLV